MKISNIFNKINNWNDFNDALITLNNKEKGDAFELLSKLYFLIDHKYQNYDNIWLLSEVPKKDLEIIGLESRDLGIDLIAKKGTEYHAIQCKYHTDKNQNVTFREVSTFISLLGGYDKLTEGYICSSAISTSKNYDDVKKKHISKLLGDTWNNLDKDFFDRVRKYLNKEEYNPIPYYPRPHQENATNEAYNHFIKNQESRGKLIFPCGAGKSLTGFWMMEKLDAMSTVIAVPSLSLIKQTLDVYLKEIVARGIKVNWLCICSDEGIGDNTEIRFKTDDIGVPCKTDPEYIKNWLIENKDTRNVIFTTYQSSRLIASISKELKHTFDLGILDEAHKTVGGRDKLFSHLLFEENISIKSRIFMTATERFYRGSKDDIVSMDDTDIYGDIFAQMSFKEAIELELLTDYKIITIDIKKSEISEFIKDNGLVELNNVWKKETEARSLASMLALRKAMRQFPIKNAVSFHSSIEKAKRNKELHSHITANYGYDPIDTYTVSGKDKTSKRNDIIQEFASSEKALITNARCLTEGVDVPNIDCIVFADPRKSKVDIVQALGRALRKKDGKDWGYVILPVIYDGETNEIDNENFDAILSIVRGLAANDERIIEYFKDKSLGKGKERSGGAEVFTMISETLSESNFAEQLNIRIWERLSRFNWMPFGEARKFVWTLGIKNVKEWNQYSKSNKKLDNIPTNPQLNYKNEGWMSYGDWLGTNIVASSKIIYRDFNSAKKYVQKLKLKTKNDWEVYRESGDKPDDIPKYPNGTYKNKGWCGYGDWLGTGTIAFHKINYRNFEEAKYFVHSLKLKYGKEWDVYCRSGSKPIDIPSQPRNTYKNKGWKGLDDWLGTGVIASQNIKYLSFSEAKLITTELELKSKKEWIEFCKTSNLNIPRKANLTYKEKGWVSWGDFLGYMNKGVRKFLSLKDAKDILWSKNISSRKEFRELTNSGNLPSNIPSNPGKVYKNNPEWKSFPDFIGYNRGFDGYNYFTFKVARNFVWKLNLKNWGEWRVHCDSKNRNTKIPKTPDQVYKDDWISIQDWLGYKKGFNGYNYLTFKEAKSYVHSLNLNSQKEWKKYTKSNLIPDNIPSTPSKFYKDKGWKGLGDWLGTGVIAASKMEFRDFEDAKNYVAKLGLKTSKEWMRYSKSGKKPKDIPSNPRVTYKDTGWIGLYDWLGKE
jgi:superfamily II DNA or RNA helicase